MGDEEMTLNKKWFLLLMAGAIVFLLAACGGSTESKILGGWKSVSGEEVTGYLEINEERYTIRQWANDEPMTVEYILTETQDDNFILEAVNPETGLNEFLFEGYFENKDTITLIGEPDDEGENSQLIRVDSILEEMEKDEKRAQAAEEKEQEKVDQEQALASEEAEKLQKEEEEEQKALAKEEALKMLDEERARASEEEKLREEERAVADEEQAAAQATIEVNGSNEYLLKADKLDESIISEAKKLFEHDMQNGFYGQYYGEWDALLNEVWGELKSTMPQSDFESLKTDQTEWIKMKEQNFAERPKEPASERAAGMDYLAFETKDRTYYLIDNYLD